MEQSFLTILMALNIYLTHLQIEMAEYRYQSALVTEFESCPFDAYVRGAFLYKRNNRMKVGKKPNKHSHKARLLTHGDFPHVSHLNDADFVFSETDQKADVVIELIEALDLVEVRNGHYECDNGLSVTFYRLPEKGENSG